MLAKTGVSIYSNGNNIELWAQHVENTTGIFIIIDPGMLFQS